MTPKEKFVEMAKGITRPGIDEMMAWLEETDFYDAPASTKFHGSVPGSLCAHSITVAKRLLELARNAKNEATGSWEKVPFYKFEPEHNVGGDNHGSLSCFLIGDHGIRLTEEEYAAVNNHMGVTAAANVNTVWDCYEKHPLSWLLHAADEAATALDKV